MASRRKHAIKKRRRGKAVSLKKKVEDGACTDNDNPNLLSSPHPQPRKYSSSPVKVITGSKRPTAHVDSAADNIRSKRMRRRGPPHHHQSCPPLLVPTTPLPLAVYQPASLFAMLLVASLLPKNTFSLRWLALSGDGFSGRFHRNNVGGTMEGTEHRPVNKLFTRQSENPSSSWLTMALDTEGGCVSCEEVAESPGGKSIGSWSRKVMLALWNDVAAALEESSRTNSRVPATDDEVDWSVDSVLDMIPRGGGQERDENTYAGLVNLGNTCYLNAQLQCAYHVPYLRELIKHAKDEVVEVEVEVEVEIEESEEQEEEKNEVENPAPECEDAGEEIEADTLEAEKAPEIQGEDVGTLKPKRTFMKKEMKEDIKPISHALKALKVTFNSLGQRSALGSTNILCRTLGINPYLQQDGQEFWKLFIPELDCDKLAKLYSGYFEDYVREILPEYEVEELVAEDDREEEKKEEDCDEGSTQKDSENKARERVRMEPFLDLSIPVAEGTGGSVESTLREMFTQPEILRVSEGNGWRPSKEAEKVDAYKGSSLKRDGLPPLLQLHLKRFKYDWETGETSKINDCCTFPLELDLSEIMVDGVDEGDEMGDEAIYDLQSIVIHKGEYGSGHYYSYVRPDIRQNKWFRFDDEFVTSVDYSDVVADAYGGNRRTRRKRSRSTSFEVFDAPVKKRRGLFQRLFSFLGFFRRVPMIGSNSSPGGGSGFGYGGRASNAYMIQYARRSDIPTLYLEDNL